MEHTYQKAPTVNLDASTISITAFTLIRRISSNFAPEYNVKPHSKTKLGSITKPDNLSSPTFSELIQQSRKKVYLL
jgi:hypothetical protein